MKSIRFIVLGAMSLLIGTGLFALFTTQASSTNGVISSPTAYIEATTVNTSFKIGGRLQELGAEEGTEVKKGEVIARLESKELENKVAQAEAAVELASGKIAEASGATQAAKAQKEKGEEAVNVTAESVEKQIDQAEAVVKAAQAKLEALKNGARPEEIKQANSKLEASKKVFEVAQETLTSMQTLFKEGAVSKVQLDEASVHYQKAKAEYEAAKEQVNMINNGARVEEMKGAEAKIQQAKAALELAIANRGKVDLQKSDVEAAQAAIQQAQGAASSAKGGKKQAEATLAEARTYLSYTELIAPVDGVIVEKVAQLGEMVNTGYPIYTIEANDTRWATFYFPEEEVIHLKKGDKVVLELVASGEKLKGEISTISPAADFAIKKASQNSGDTDIRSFSVKVLLPELSRDIPTGMTVKWMNVTKGETHAN